MLAINDTHVPSLAPTVAASWRLRTGFCLLGEYLWPEVQHRSTVCTDSSLLGVEQRLMRPAAQAFGPDALRTSMVSGHLPHTLVRPSTVKLLQASSCS